MPNQVGDEGLFLVISGTEVSIFADKARQHHWSWQLGNEDRDGERGRCGTRKRGLTRLRYHPARCLQSVSHHHATLPHAWRISPSSTQKYYGGCERCGVSARERLRRGDRKAKLVHAFTDRCFGTGCKHVWHALRSRCLSEN